MGQSAGIYVNIGRPGYYGAEVVEKVERDIEARARDCYCYWIAVQIQAWRGITSSVPIREESLRAWIPLVRRERDFEALARRQCSPAEVRRICVLSAPSLIQEVPVR